MSQFKLVSPFQPMGDQVQAIQELVDGLKAGKKEQVWNRKNIYCC